MAIQTTPYHRVDVVKMDGRVDTFTAPQLQEVLDALIEDNRANIVFDMTDVNFLSSKGLHVLTETQKKAKKLNGQLVLVNASERIRESFKMVAMDGYFEHFDDLTAAVGSF